MIFQDVSRLVEGSGPAEGIKVDEDGACKRCGGMDTNALLGG